jgi:Toprim domain-containing protein
MNIRALATALGGDVVGGNTVSAPGPGHSPRDRSLSVRLDASAPDGFLAYSHSGDDWKVCRDYVRQRLGLPDWQPGDERNRRIPPSQIKKWDLAMIEAEAKAGPREWSEDELLRIGMAKRIWDQAANPKNTLAHIYLSDHRKLDLTEELSGSVLRFHRACPWREESSGQTIKVPALIAAFRSVDDDSITGIHRIRLNPDGSKYGRRMLGIVHRSAVKLSPLTDTLAIGEGVESCMAAQQLGYTPVWAVGSVGAISFFPILNGVERLVLLAETGRPSEDAIKICGTRWQRERRKVQVIRPLVGSDLNDVLIDQINNNPTQLEKNAL